MGYQLLAVSCQPDARALAAEPRQNAAQGLSPGVKSEVEMAPKGRKRGGEITVRSEPI